MTAAPPGGAPAGWVRRSWPLLAALGLLAALALWTLAAGLGRTDGRLSYALDDAYIHLALARSFAEHGVWGLTRYEFSSSSSSLLWTLLLAAGRRLGAGDWLPLLLNLAAALGLVVGADRALRDDGWPAPPRAAALAALLLAAGITPLIFSGMEHTLQLGLTLWLARLASADLARAREVPAWQIGLLALLNVMIRYEGLFLAALIGLGYLLQRRWGRMLLVGAAAALPVVVFGLVAASNGWPFLPASVVAKTRSLQQSAFPLLPHFSGGRLTLRSVVCLALSLGWLAAALPRLRAGASRRWAVFHALAAGTLLLHLMYARTGWFYRYEAYLVFLNALALLQAARELRPAPRARPAVAGLAGASVALLAALVFDGIGETPRAMGDIYLQHYQMARFAGQYPLPGAVGLNDIGAVAYYTDRPILDFFGLASRETLLLRGGEGFSAAAYERLARERGVSLVMVYDTPDWLSGKIPASWRKIGTMSLVAPPTIAAEQTVSIFVTRPEDAPAAAAAWRAFIPTLPAGATGRAETP